MVGLRDAIVGETFRRYGNRTLDTLSKNRGSPNALRIGDRLGLPDKERTGKRRYVHLRINPAVVPQVSSMQLQRRMCD